MKNITSILTLRQVFVIIVIAYVVDAAMSFNRVHNIDKLEAYYGSFASFDGDKANLTIGELVSFAKQQLGKPYHPAGKGPDAFDCSGFTGYVFKHFGIRLPASARGQALRGEVVFKDEIQPGDLVFFAGSDVSSKVIGHVGIVTSVNAYGVKFIHSSTGNGVMINDLVQDSYYQIRYKGARRIGVN